MNIRRERDYMKTGKYELVVKWNYDTSDVDIFEYPTEEMAEEFANGYRMAFGDQVWCCVRPQYVK